MRPSLVAMSKKARKFPMTGKHGNKHFYKGTGTLPGLNPKRQGRHPFSGNAPYILMPSRMNKFVPPEDPNWEQSALRPYVSRVTPVSHEMARREDAYPQWPYAYSKGLKRHGGIEDAKLKSVTGLVSKLSTKGYDAAYHLQLVHAQRQRDGNLSYEDMFDEPLDSALEYPGTKSSKEEKQTPVDK